MSPSSFSSVLVRGSITRTTASGGVISGLEHFRSTSGGWNARYLSGNGAFPASSKEEETLKSAQES